MPFENMRELISFYLSMTPRSGFFPPKKKKIMGVIIQKCSILLTTQKKKRNTFKLQVPYIYTNFSISRKHTATTKHYIHKMFSLNIFAYTRKKKKSLYPISETISGGNFASRAAWNLFSAYRALSPVVREYFVYKTRRGEEPFPATGYQNRSPSLE